MWAVLPVKAFAEAKQRLAGVLDAGQRAALAKAMMRDVLRALAATPALEGIMVISPDPAVLEIGASFGAIGEREARPTGYNHAVAQAAARVIAGAGDGMLLLPGDVPLVTPGDLQELLRGQPAAPAAAVVGDRGRGGTNALVLSPADLIAPVFGDDSFARHCAAVRAAGVEPRTPALPGLALDIDLPEDLGLLLRQTQATESGRLLQEINATTPLAGPAGK